MMYENFTWVAPTRVIFRAGSAAQTVREIRRFGGTRMLLVYGGHSAERSGLLGCIREELRQEQLPFVELGGIVPNPHLDKVLASIALGRAEAVDFLLAVGGGSVIDTTKAIGYGLSNDGDVWELFEHRA